uniref:uncharacterized protein LOC109968598 isoform X3 n=1 Tax=Monopterus albus TaxID=43700 RepID=UPI0009B41E3F|nr:uncharacterized protein LOC109968598 isoform X3 [Monopterus albus]
MGEVHLDELDLGAGFELEAEKQGCPEVEEKELRTYCKPQRTPTKGDISITGAVTMETRGLEEEKLPKKMEEEEVQRWRELFPEIKKCMIVVVRHKFDKLNVLKQKQEEEEVRSHDPEPVSDWMEPLEPGDDSSSCGRLKRFVKKVEVKVKANHVPVNRPRRPCGRHRGSAVLKLRQSCDVISVNPTHRQRHLHKRTKENNNIIDPSETDHNYSLNNKLPDSPEGGSQSQGASLSSCGHEAGDSSSCSTGPAVCPPPLCANNTVFLAEKKNPPPIVFKKVGGDQWVLRRSEVKKQEEEGDKKMKTKNENLPPHMQALCPRKRRTACRQCEACLREDCGKCTFCRDKKKFGGPERMKQKCRLRTCLVMRQPAPSTSIQAGEETVSTATAPAEPCGHWWGRWRDENTTEEEGKNLMQGRKGWGWRWERNRAKMKRDGKWTHRWRKKEEEAAKRGPAQEMGWRRWRSRWRWRKRESEDDDWTPPLTRLEEDEEEEQKEEVKKEEPNEMCPSHLPGCPADCVHHYTVQFPSFELVSGTGELPPEGLMTGTHIQLNLTLDRSHFTPSILSDATFNTQSGLQPQEGSGLHMSTGLAYTPSSLHPLLLQPKEEEEAVDIDMHRRMGAEDGGMMEETTAQVEEEECRKGVTDGGKYYEVEVEVPGSDSEEEMLMAASLAAEVTDDVTKKVTYDVTASYPIYKPPECISLSSGSFHLLGGGLSDGVTGGWSLLRLLRALRRMVLPAHWVAVLADGPLLQLLQCSRLSSMADTIVHIQPDRCFYITVQSRLLPDTHTLYHTHTLRITNLSQVVSLLLELEQLIICRGSRVRSSTCRLDVRSPTCHLLVAPPCLTCLPCLLDGEEEEEEDEEEEEVREDELPVAEPCPHF